MRLASLVTVPLVPVTVPEPHRNRDACQSSGRQFRTIGPGPRASPGLPPSSPFSCTVPGTLFYLKYLWSRDSQRPRGRSCVRGQTGTPPTPCPPRTERGAGAAAPRGWCPQRARRECLGRWGCPTSPRWWRLPQPGSVSERPGFPCVTYTPTHLTEEKEKPWERQPAQQFRAPPCRSPAVRLALGQGLQGSEVRLGGTPTAERGPHRTDRGDRPLKRKSDPIAILLCSVT